MRHRHEMQIDWNNGGGIAGHRCRSGPGPRHRSGRRRFRSLHHHHLRQLVRLRDHRPRSGRTEEGGWGPHGTQHPREGQQRNRGIHGHPHSRGCLSGQRPDSQGHRSLHRHGDQGQRVQELQSSQHGRPSRQHRVHRKPGVLQLQVPLQSEPEPRLPHQHRRPGVLRVQVDQDPHPSRWTRLTGNQRLRRL